MPSSTEAADTRPAVADWLRVGVFGGVVLTGLLFALTLYELDTAIGLGVLWYGVRLGNVSPSVLAEFPSIAAFGLPGLLVGLGAGYRSRRGGPVSRRSQALLVAALTVVPVVLTVVLGIAGFAFVVLWSLIDGGALAALTLGAFVGALVLGIALGGAVALVFFVGVPASAGVLFGDALAERIGNR